MTQLSIVDTPLSDKEEKLNDIYNNQKCVDTQQKGIKSVNASYYQNTLISKVFNAISFNRAYNFREKIGVGEHRSVTNEDENMKVEVEYKWKGKNKLEIIQHFAGGETSYIFKHKKNGTKLTTIDSAD